MQEVKRVQKQYFIESVLDKVSYEKLMFKLETELKEINNLLKEGEKK
jgi:hypothetical protein